MEVARKASKNIWANPLDFRTHLKSPSRYFSHEKADLGVGSVSENPRSFSPHRLDFAEIKDGAFGGDPSVFDNTPNAVILAALDPFGSAQKHDSARGIVQSSGGSGVGLHQSLSVR